MAYSPTKCELCKLMHWSINGQPQWCWWWWRWWYYWQRCIGSLISKSFVPSELVNSHRQIDCIEYCLHRSYLYCLSSVQIDTKFNYDLPGACVPGLINVRWYYLIVYIELKVYIRQCSFNNCRSIFVCLLTIINSLSFITNSCCRECERLTIGNQNWLRMQERAQLHTSHHVLAGKDPSELNIEKHLVVQ